MTAPATMVKRRLTINFQRSVKAGIPQVMEVVVAPLTTPSSPSNDATLVGGPQQQNILLSNENNPVIFDLIPTDHPDLTTRLTYRVAWREKFMGRQYTQDFVMPDFDTDFDSLGNLGNLISGQTYIQWTDRLRPGGVAGLNDAGQVIDSEGAPVTGAESASIVQGHLDSEVVSRQQADQNLYSFFVSHVNSQMGDVYSTITNNIAAEQNSRENFDLIEKTARISADNAIRSDMAGLVSDLENDITGLEDAIGDINTELESKADLVNGKIPSDQIPSQALGHAVVVADEAEMLALTTEQVQVGDLCVRPDGTFILNGANPAMVGNWVKLSSAASVSSVNGQTGTVVLSAANVGARPAAQPIPLADITGLQSALDGKTNIATSNNINGRLTAMENDPTIVRVVGGVIPHPQHGNDVAFLNVDGQIVNKAGQVMNIGGAGGILDIDDVTGLQTALDTKVAITDVSVTNPRPPTPHAVNHATGGPDPITPASIGARATADPVPQADIDGLPPIVSNNNLTTSSNFGNRISTLETTVSGLAPGPAGTLPKATWWDHTTTIAPTTDPTAFNPVIQKSPFGRNSSGQYYYNPAGAAEGESVYPYISPNGHLTLVQRNEANAPDPVKANQTDLDTTNTAVATKASQASLDATNSTVATKANQSSLDATNAAVALRATVVQHNALADIVAVKANQADLDTTNAAVATKAAAADLATTNAAVALKANQSDLNTANTNITNLQTYKANLAGGKVPLAELPDLPEAKVIDLTTRLAAKADLVSSQVPVVQIPFIPTSKVTGLDGALMNKADLVGGTVPTSQLPALAYNTTVVVSTKAAMLGLTPTQVQPGDVCVISSGADKGSYILTAADPSNIANWTALSSPDAPVQSVNGQTGTVVLSASDVGARASGVPMAQSEITGLTSTLAGKADNSALTAGLATKPSFAEVDTRISQSTNNKLPAALVATTAIPTLSGQQSIDGVLAPVGTAVLVTNQSSSVNNGLYYVASGAWNRVADMVNGDYFIKGTLVTVTGGMAHHDTIWQITSASGVVGTNAQTWTKTITAGAPPVYTASLGVQRVVNDFRAQVVSGGGIIAVPGGLQLDPTIVARKYAGDVPAGSTIVTITHNLNSTDVTAAFREKASGDAILVGWRPTGVNTISAEFASAPAAGQWRCTVIG